MTGWGQSGPYAQAAGRDINYVALSGTLSMIGRAGGAPVPPPLLVGDYGGGGMLMAFGLLCGIVEASRSGTGQVVDAAMLDGAAVLAGLVHGLRADGQWGERGTNLFDTGRWFYEVYETADGRFVSLGAIDPRAQQELLELMDVDAVDGKEQMADLVRTKTRDEWCELLEGTDVCFAPVLEPGEAPEHPHVRERGTFVDIGGVVQPAPAPRFSRTPTETPEPPVAPGTHTRAALVDWGFDDAEVEALAAVGAVSLPPI
jgi:alpha-methylacyl-CoA racemase